MHFSDGEQDKVVNYCHESQSMRTHFLTDKCDISFSTSDTKIPKFLFRNHSYDITY